MHAWIKLTRNAQDGKMMNLRPISFKLKKYFELVMAQGSREVIIRALRHKRRDRAILNKRMEGEDAMSITMQKIKVYRWRGENPGYVPSRHVEYVLHTYMYIRNREVKIKMPRRADMEQIRREKKREREKRKKVKISEFDARNREYHETDDQR